MNTCCTRLTTTASTLVVFGLGTPRFTLAQTQLSFSEPVIYPTATEVAGIVPADMTGDGRTDLLVSEWLETVSLFGGVGAGQFRVTGSLYQQATFLESIIATDLNGDLITDAVWPGSGLGGDGLFMFYNSGNGRTGRLHFIPHPRPIRYIASGDFNNDGSLDLIAVDDRASSALVHYFENQNGQLTLVRSLGPADSHNTGLAVGDFDGDGDLDFAVNSLNSRDSSEYGWKLYSSHVQIFYNNDGQGSFSQTELIELPWGPFSTYDDLFPVDLQAGDLDGDGDIDLLVAAIVYENPALLPEILIVENVDHGTSFITHDPLLLPRVSRKTCAVSLGDLDSDGDLDIAYRDFYGLWTLENLRNLNFAEARSITDQNYSNDSVLLLSDFDGNGQLDIAAGNPPGFVTLLNTTAINNPILQQPLLKRGAPATLRVTGAQPGEQVDFFYSRTGAGNSPGQPDYGGLILDLLAPITPAGSAIADSDGSAELELDIPANAPLIPLVIQAAIARGPEGVDSVKTPFRSTRILP